MIVLISGATHAGKTLLAQRLMERYKMPYYSIDHLKMGLIRSGQTSLTVDNDKELVPYLWKIVKEIIKTAIENGQNLIVEGAYIPFDWQKDFGGEYLKDIKFFCLIMSEKYIENNFSAVTELENIIERRRYAGEISKSELIKENARNLQLCKKYKLDYVFIDKDYQINIEL